MQEKIKKKKRQKAVLRCEKKNYYCNKKGKIKSLQTYNPKFNLIIIKLLKALQKYAINNYEKNAKELHHDLKKMCLLQ